MVIECGICGNKDIAIEDRSSLCFNCGDAIRRLVWIAEQESARRQQTVANEETVLEASWENLWAILCSAVCSFFRLPENEGGKSTTPARRTSLGPDYRGAPWRLGPKATKQ